MSHLSMPTVVEQNLQLVARLITGFSVLLLVFVFFKNAWVAEDAYIVFRSVEQLFAGNGPVWNPHERVQAFTSPLWFWLLAFARLFVADLYLIAVCLSFVLLLVAWSAWMKLLGEPVLLLLCALFLVGSNGFFDFTSSGLENPLAYLLISLYFLFYCRVFDQSSGSRSSVALASDIAICLLLFGLIICVRHDLVLLLLPATVYMVVANWQCFSIRQWLIRIALSLSPFLLWSLFSLIYYGFPFPNTAYAKLATGIDKLDLLQKGGLYFVSAFRDDLLTIVVILLAMVLGFRAGTYFRYLGFGIGLNLLYIAYVGGDFMLGRFFSFSYLLAVFLLLTLLKLNPKFFVLKWLGALLVLYVVFYPHTPLMSPFAYSNLEIRGDVADERGYYFRQTSVYRYLAVNGDGFPDDRWCEMGRSYKDSQKITVFGSVGMFGYCAGVNNIIVDWLALADPFLARLPVSVHTQWRVGHFERIIPAGYVQSLYLGTNLIQDDFLRQRYEKIKLITQSKSLFSLDRFREIIRFNMGLYEKASPVSQCVVCQDACNSLCPR